VPSDKNHNTALRNQWLHEIKHDGFRIIARKSDGRVRLYNRAVPDCFGAEERSSLKPRWTHLHGASQ
jgi:ATP-dependent DNA ligase